MGELYGRNAWNAEDALSKDTNDGLTPETAVHTLNRAMELLKTYDTASGGATAGNLYPYPKIVLLYNRIEDSETLNFSAYRCEEGISSYGYRASVWMQDNYKMISHSECAVQVTSVQAAETVWSLKDSADDLKAGEIYLNVNGLTVTERAADVSGNTLWRMAEPTDEEGATLKLPLSAKIAGGSVNEDGESRACAVTYTVKAVK